MERKYLIAYDISDIKRLSRVAKTMEDFGVRVQKSIFEASLTKKSLGNLKRELLNVMNPDEDGVKFFIICPKCEQRVNIIGQGVETDLFQSSIIV